MGAFSIWHWGLVLLVLILVFGGSTASRFMGDFGRGLRLFKRNISDVS